MLRVGAETAAALDLRQVVPDELRSARKAEKEAKRRRDAGAERRDVWLTRNSQARERPWEAQGISESTWRRRRRRAAS